MIDLQGKVVVLTGASSGLGREAAAHFARRGSVLVLAARRGEALEETASACREVGGSAFCVVTDVTVEEDVNALVRTALEPTGTIDVWINGAGVTLFAPLDQGPFEEHRRVIEVNLIGPMLCARAMLPILRQQRRGVLINVGSILSKVGQPFVPSYIISKFGLRGLTEALRADLADLPDVHVCSLLPYAIDTPHFQAGANYIGREPRPVPPTLSPETVAEALVRLAERPRREVHVPRVAALGLLLHDLAPRPVERLVSDIVREWHFAERGEAPNSGNLYEPESEPGEVHGKPPKGGALSFGAWLARHLAGKEPEPPRDEAAPPTPNPPRREREPA